MAVEVVAEVVAVRTAIMDLVMEEILEEAEALMILATTTIGLQSVDP